jgi:NADPH2 dehydrogenase
MDTLDLNRYSPLPLTADRLLKNRVVLPPMASQTATPEGFATTATFDHYARLARSGAGLLIAEYTFVHASGRSEDNQLGASTDAHIAGLTEIAKIFKSSGAVAGLQLSHGGGKSDRQLTSGFFMGPSGIAVPVKNETLEAPAIMSLDDVLLWKNAFVAAAGRAVQAGFELVEFHSAHGYGLNQFLSPITNRRDDAYGKNLAGRARLLIEIVSEVRSLYPQLLISVRIPGQDFLENGLTTADMIEVARMLENAGVHLIHVSSGIGGWRRPADRTGQGYLVSEAAAIQKNIRLPVIGVGGIETGLYIDGALQSGLFALAAVGRAILGDPPGWHAQNLPAHILCAGILHCG